MPSLCSVFALLLADRNWLLEQHALEAFTQFAEVRPTIAVTCKAFQRFRHSRNSDELLLLAVKFSAAEGISKDEASRSVIPKDLWVVTTQQAF